MSLIALNYKYSEMVSKKSILIPVITFILITSLISAAIFIWMFNGAKDSIEAVLPMMFTPGISAIITALIFKEKIRSFGWSPGRPRYLLYSLLIPLLVSVIAYGITWLTPYAGFTTENVVNYKWARMIGFSLPAPFIAGFLSKLVIGTLATSLIVFGEEVGWSGYLTPKLRQIFSVPVTSVLVGLYWSAWHYPAIIGGFYGTGTPLWIALPGFTLVLTGASFIRTVVVEKSGSLWPGVLVHASHNVILMGMFLEMTAQESDLNIHYIVSETGVFVGVVYVLAGIGFWRIMGGVGVGGRQ